MRPVFLVSISTGPHAVERPEACLGEAATRQHIAAEWDEPHSANKTSSAAH